jgi:hypothetical protein
MSKNLSIILRGHIRKSFSDKTLYNYIKNLSDTYNLTIYIQTWNILQSNVSWRFVESDTTRVDRELITNYFGKDISNKIKHILILDDTQLHHTGKTSGRMGNTSGSYLGWKNMWYGIHKIASIVKEVSQNPDHFIINTRFDVFNNSVSFALKTINDKLNFIMKSSINPETITKNIFLKDVEFFGMDNFYIGNVNTILKLAHRFNTNLDAIVEKYKKVTSHEFYTFHVNNTLFLENWLDPAVISPPLLPNTTVPIAIELPKDAPLITKNDIVLPNVTVNISQKPSIVLTNEQDKMMKQVANLTADTNFNPTILSNRTNKSEAIDLTIFQKNKDPFYSNSADFSSSFDNDHNIVTKKQIDVLPSMTHNRSGEMSIIDSSISTLVNNPSSLDNSQLKLLVASIINKNKSMTLFENPSIQPITDLVISNDEAQNVSLSLSNHNRINAMQLFDSSSLKSKNIPVIPNDELKFVTLSTSTHTKSTIPLFEPSAINSNSVSVNTGNNSLLSLQPANINRNNFMPLLDSTLTKDQITTHIIDNNKVLETLPSSRQNKSALIAMPDPIPVTTTNIEFINPLSVLSSSTISRKAKIALVDATAKNPNPFQPNPANLVTSVIKPTGSRSSMPLINVNTKEEPNRTISTNSIILTNVNNRNNVPDVPIKQEVNNVNVTQPSVIENPIVIENKKELAPVESPPVIIPTPVINNVNPVNKPIEDLKIYNKSNLNSKITKPVPIRKFKVSLDPSNIESSTSVQYKNTQSVTNTKMLHGDKFKTTTQPLSSYYALLSS